MRKESNSGFSMLDLLIVVSVATVILAMAVPSVQRSFRNYELAAGADQLASELNAARVLAVSRGTLYRIVFDTSNNTFQVVDLSDVNNPTLVRKRLASGLQLVSVPAQAITFSSRGTARGGTVVLSNRAGKTMIVEVGDSGKTTVHDMVYSPTYGGTAVIGEE